VYSILEKWDCIVFGTNWPNEGRARGHENSRIFLENERSITDFVETQQVDEFTIKKWYSYRTKGWVNIRAVFDPVKILEFWMYHEVRGDVLDISYNKKNQAQ